MTSAEPLDSLRWYVRHGRLDAVAAVRGLRPEVVQHWLRWPVSHQVWGHAEGMVTCALRVPDAKRVRAVFGRVLAVAGSSVTFATEDGRAVGLERRGRFQDVTSYHADGDTLMVTLRGNGCLRLDAVEAQCVGYCERPSVECGGEWSAKECGW